MLNRAESKVAKSTKNVFFNEHIKKKGNKFMNGNTVKIVIILPFKNNKSFLKHSGHFLAVL